jgi:hypothetical protein
MRRTTFCLASIFQFTLGCAAQENGWDRLLELHQDFRVLRDAGMNDFVHDFSPATVQARAAQLGELQDRLRKIDPSAWPIDRKVDWVRVRTEVEKGPLHFRRETHGGKHDE